MKFPTCIGEKWFSFIAIGMTWLKTQSDSCGGSWGKCSETETTKE